MNRTAFVCFALTSLACTSAEAQGSRATAPITTLAEANAEARRRPDPANFTDATHIYDYAPGAIYEVYGAPGFISTVLLEPGETIVTVAAGDTTRWMVEQAVGGDVANARAMLLIKPTRASIRTNIVLITDRRTYAIEAIATSGQTYSAQTAWRYPADADDELAGAPAALETLNFGYRIRTVRGFNPHWRPVRVFDDGAKTYIEFPPAMATSEAPPLFVIENGEAGLVNYRVSGSRYVIDRLFDIAELRLGAERPQIVRISRDDAHAPRTARRGRRP
ncbi:MAG: P-type conjugative transfer protein TrbG [Hydrogenophilaceae bacterium]|jgi:type IV secretion system protein VirB9|nr:P-type conjugative transfer protein TrbG [Hydrogenophilaceae bacterium]